MSRESRIEQRGCEELEMRGCPTLKMGWGGWPDRIAFPRPLEHFFVEWKQPGGSLTPAQRRRIPKLRLRGEAVAVLDAWQDAVVALTFFMQGNWMSHKLFNEGALK